METTKHVAKSSIKVIAITDNILSPLTALPNINFFVVTENPRFFRSIMSMMVVLDALADMVKRRR